MTCCPRNRSCGAYCFLRDVEHRLQMEDNLQTHTIPTTSRPGRLAKLMSGRRRGVRNGAADPHRPRSQFPSLLKSEADPPASADSFFLVNLRVRRTNGRRSWLSTPSGTRTRPCRCCASLSKGPATFTCLHEPPDWRTNSCRGCSPLYARSAPDRRKPHPISSGDAFRPRPRHRPGGQLHLEDLGRAGRAV